MKNRELFQSITHAARSHESNPSTSKQCAKETNNVIEGKPTTVVSDWDHLFDDFDVTEQEMSEIDGINQLKETESSKSEFQIAKNEKLIVPCIQSKVPTHFTSKPPVKVAFTNAQKEPPLKKRKTGEEGVNTNFHGNIINNFYSQKDSEKNENRKKEC